MATTIEAMFDGEVLRPAETAGLETNRRYRITLEPVDEAASSTAGAPAGQTPSTGEDKFRALVDIANEIGYTGFAEKLKKPNS